MNVNMGKNRKKKKKMMTRHEFFKKRLEMLDLYSGRSDYEGKIGCCVEQLSELLQKQGHSGVSEQIVLKVFNELVSEWEAYGQIAADVMFKEKK